MKKRLENIDEELENGSEWLPALCHQPKTPTESMEFLSRSWSLSATQLSKALFNNTTNNDTTKQAYDDEDEEQKPLDLSTPQVESGNSLLNQDKPLLTSLSPPMSPRVSDETKESSFQLLREALNPVFFSNQQQQLLRNGVYMRSMMMKRKSIGRWMKDEKEKKKQEIRAHNAQLHAAVSVAGVAAAVASLVSSGSLASASALVASHCIETAENIGASHEEILLVVNSAINARSNGDIMALTAGAATALRGASTLRARLYKDYGELESTWNHKESSSTISIAALDFVSRGGELLKRTRKGDLHWKQVSFNINSNWQVVAKMKSKHMGGTFTKKKKCVVSGIHNEIPAWPGREREDDTGEQSYFAIQTNDNRIIEFESRTKADKLMWVQGIQHMLTCNQV